MPSLTCWSRSGLDRSGVFCSGFSGDSLLSNQAGPLRTFIASICRITGWDQHRNVSQHLTSDVKEKSQDEQMELVGQQPYCFR